MRQKVITVISTTNVLTEQNTSVAEIQYPVLNKLLSQGWQVISVHQSQANQASFSFITTFVIGNQNLAELPEED